MTRYSASRAIMYTAPPAEEDDTAVDVEAETAEPAAADD